MSVRARADESQFTSDIPSSNAKLRAAGSLASSDSAPRTAGSLASLLRHAGAVYSDPDLHSAPLHFGSAAGELAVCVSAVGLLDRSDLTKLAIEARPEQLSGLVGRVAGGSLATGGALFAGSAWWCGAGPASVIVVCEPDVGVRLRARLLAERPHVAGLVVRDRSDELASIGIIGRRTVEVLRALGVYGKSGDPRRVSPFTGHSLAGTETLWLLESDHRALALVAREDASRAWQAIEQAGRRFGMSYVGLDAARRYALVQRAAAVPA